jgi:hypothetical protein
LKLVRYQQLLVENQQLLAAINSYWRQSTATRPVSTATLAALAAEMTSLLASYDKLPEN